MYFPSPFLVSTSNSTIYHPNRENKNGTTSTKPVKSEEQIISPNPLQTFAPDATNVGRTSKAQEQEYSLNNSGYDSSNRLGPIPESDQGEIPNEPRSSVLLKENLPSSNGTTSSARTKEDWDRAQQELADLAKKVQIQTHVNAYLSKVNCMVQQAPDDVLQIPKDACGDRQQKDTQDLRVALTASLPVLLEHRESAEEAYQQALHAIQQGERQLNHAFTRHDDCKADDDSQASSLSSGSRRRARTCNPGR